MNLSRRGLFVGLGAVLAAPFIVRVASIMPVRPLFTEADFRALMERKIKEMEARMVQEMTALIWGDNNLNDPIGLEKWVRDSYPRELVVTAAKPAPVRYIGPDDPVIQPYPLEHRRYEWRNGAATRSGILIPV